MIKFEDYEDENGNIDWNSYHKAEVEVGERCMTCGESIIFGKGYPTECRNCKDIQTEGTAHHNSRVRCPKCRHVWNPYDTEDYHVFEEGDHEIGCYECNHTFSVSTIVEYTFCSPDYDEGD
jgi:hypothetical protein